jgi:PadR family transcriptional regulator PadR
MRRKAGALTPIEFDLLTTMAELHATVEEVHGYELSKAHQARTEARLPIPFGSLYRALDRMERFGYVTSRLEAAEVAEAERRPRRRLYQMTGAGREVLRRAEAAAMQPPRLRTRGATA